MRQLIIMVSLLIIAAVSIRNCNNDKVIKIPLGEYQIIDNRAATIDSLINIIERNGLDEK